MCFRVPFSEIIPQYVRVLTSLFSTTVTYRTKHGLASYRAKRELATYRNKHGLTTYRAKCQLFLLRAKHELAIYRAKP